MGSLPAARRLTLFLSADELRTDNLGHRVDDDESQEETTP